MSKDIKEREERRVKYQEWLDEVDLMILEMADTLGPEFETGAETEINEGWEPHSLYKMFPNTPGVGLESLLSWLYDNGAQSIDLHNNVIVDPEDADEMIEIVEENQN